MNKANGYDNFKRVLAFIMGLIVLATSLYFSVEGFDFKVENQNIWWVGWVLALAVTSSQFMFNTRPKELNWTIIILGAVAYGYSIWSNIMGFYALRGTSSVYDWMNISGGIFMDVFPETAIAWALGAIKTGDLFGNLLSVMQDPDTVSNTPSSLTNSKNPDIQAFIKQKQNQPKPVIHNGAPVDLNTTFHQFQKGNKK